MKLIMLTVLTLQQQKQSTHTHKRIEKVLQINNNKNVSQSAVCIQLQYLILEYHDKKQVLPGKTWTAWACWHGAPGLQRSSGRSGYGWAVHCSSPDNGMHSYS